MQVANFIDDFIESQITLIDDSKYGLHVQPPVLVDTVLMSSLWKYQTMLNVIT